MNHTNVCKIQSQKTMERKEYNWEDPGGQERPSEATEVSVFPHYII